MRHTNGRTVRMAAAVVLVAAAVLGSTSAAGAAIDIPPLDVGPAEPVVGENITVSGPPCFTVGEGDRIFPGELFVEFMRGDPADTGETRYEGEKDGGGRPSSGKILVAPNADGTWSIAWAPVAKGALRIEVTCIAEAGDSWLQSATMMVGAKPEIIVAVDKHAVYVTDEVMVNEEGFLPGEDVDVVLHSDPIKLGTLTADKVGMVTGTFNIPTGAVLGDHEVHLTGLTSGRTGLDKVTIIADTKGQNLNDKPAKTDGGSRRTDSTNHAGVSGRTAGSTSNRSAAELAYTGGSSWTLTVFGLVTLLGGTVLVATGRRMNRAWVSRLRA